MKINVAVIFGGKSVEHEVAIISAQQAIAALNKEKYNVIPLYITKKGVMYTGKEMCSVESFQDLPALLQRSHMVTLVNDGSKINVVPYPKPLFGGKAQTIDVAFPVMHGTNCEDGTIQGYLELLGVPYVGPNILASAVGMDKIIMKNILKENGIPVLDCVHFYAREWYEKKEQLLQKIEEIGYPVIVKPANLGSSVGIKKAADAGEAVDAVENAASFADRILVEKAITQLREINCAVLGDSSEARASVCEEPIAGDEILSYDDKYKGGGKSAKGMSGASRKVPADLDDATREKIQMMCIETFRALCCSGVARVDCMIDRADGSVYVNEINTIPGSLAFYLWEAAGLSFEQLTDELIRLALKRQRERENLTFSYDTNILQLQGGAKGAKGAK